MDDNQILNIVREFLENKKLHKTSAALSQELQGVDHALSAALKSSIFTANQTSAHVGTLPTSVTEQQQTTNKLGVLAEVEDEDQSGSPSSLSGPNNLQKVDIPALSNIQIDPKSSKNIPIMKLKGKGDGIEKPKKKANSYQPPSTLAHGIPTLSNMFDTSNNHIVANGVIPTNQASSQQFQHIRPKRVSTSTGHQRPTTDDELSSVPLNMALSGLIPLPDIHTASASAPKRTLANAALEPARSTPGSSSMSTDRSRRSRTSSVSEENRSLYVLTDLPDPLAVSARETVPEDLQPVMTCPKLASPPTMATPITTTYSIQSSSTSTKESTPVTSSSSFSTNADLQAEIRPAQKPGEILNASTLLPVVASSNNSTESVTSKSISSQEKSNSGTATPMSELSSSLGTDDLTDEYSDDDDLGYLRISGHGVNPHYLAHHYSVFGDTSSDSDDIMESFSDSSSWNEDSSTDDEAPKLKKATKSQKNNLKKLKDLQAPVKMKGTPAKATTATMFDMDDVEASMLNSEHQKFPYMSRPLPPEGPQPALKLPTNPDPVQNKPQASSSGLDYSIVNVRKSRNTDNPLEYFNMKIVYDRQKTGFEATHDFPIRIADVIAGRYEIVEYLGSAAFSRAVKCIDHLKGTTVCLKIIKNNKDYFDQSLDEIKLLTLIKNACQDRCDDFHVLELYDYFYFKEHLFLVCELLRENLYEVYKYNRQSGEVLYFNISRLQRVAWQCLVALNFIHSKNLIHCDLKPENILIKSYSRSLIKVIDFGSSCFTTDQLSSYVQSRSYRAPEVVLGCPYDQRIDMWSLGCILAELWTGRVLFQNESLSTLIAKHIGIIGLEKKDIQYLKEAPLADDIFTPDGVIYEKKAATPTSPATIEYIHPKKTSLRKRLQTTDALFLSFVSSLLKINPGDRPTAWQAMHHPWFRQVYPDP